jgi:hypothetical protein
MKLRHRGAQAALAVVLALVVGVAPRQALAQDHAKLWIDSAAVDTFRCAGLTVQLVNYDRDDPWFGHVFELRLTNPTDSTIHYAPTFFAAVLRDRTQQTFPSAQELTERALSGYWGRHNLKSPAEQDRKRAELQSRRDLVAEDILPGASSVKRIALGPSVSGGIAIGGRSAEQLKEYKESDIPLVMYCKGQRVGVVSKPIKH